MTKLWVPGGPDWQTPVLNDWLDELRRHHIRAEIEWIGGGLTVLEIPLSEDGSRYVWLCWDEDDGKGWTEPVHADEWGPTANGVIGGCVYWWPEGREVDYGLQGYLMDEPVNGDPTAAVERILKQAMFFDPEQMEEW